jgi:hypothetical protein
MCLFHSLFLTVTERENMPQTKNVIYFLLLLLFFFFFIFTRSLEWNSDHSIVGDNQISYWALDHQKLQTWFPTNIFCPQPQLAYQYQLKWTTPKSTTTCSQIKTNPHHSRPPPKSAWICKIVDVSHSLYEMHQYNGLVCSCVEFSEWCMKPCK